MDAILPVYKKSGVTSYNVIRLLKKELGKTTKIGHAGTLDPFAEGVLLILLGKATKKFGEIQKWEKVYEAEVILGAKSDTLDKDGKIESVNCEPPNISSLRESAESLVGRIEQEVPAYSAAKHKGVPMYKLAREGKPIPQKNKIVNVYKLEITEYEYPKAKIIANVSSGTYIRQLSYDLFKSLGVESYLSRLVRKRIGKVDVERCCNMDNIINGEWKDYLIE